MKKILIAILSLMMILCAGLVVSCSEGGSWTKPTLKSGGDVLSYEGFVAETQNYLYFINGVGKYTDDNAFGKPVKGALAVVEKAKLGTSDEKVEIVVPKLFITEDYNAGICFNNGYVYYGTPSVARKSTGEINNDALAIAKTSLDGEKTEILFTANCLDIKYVFAVKDNAVNVIWADDSDSTIKCYNETTGKNTVIAKTDAKTNEKVNGEYVSLDFSSIKFTKNGVVFTETVYAEEYNEEQAKTLGYSRRTANYNVLRAYSLDTDKTVSGKETTAKYSITNTFGDYLFYKETVNGKDTTYGETFANLESAKKILNADYLTGKILIDSLSEIYTLDTTAKFVYKTSLIENERDIKAKVAKADTISSLLFIDGGNIYYYNSSNKIARKELNNYDANEIVVSDGTALTTWYNPQILTVNSKNLMFYINSTTVGSSYVNYVDLNGEIKENDIDNNGETDEYVLEGNKFVGVMLDSDKANVIVDAINKIDATLTLEKGDDGVLYSEQVKNAREVYNTEIEKNAKLKDYISASVIGKLENAEKAVELANKYLPLKKDYSSLTTDEKKALKNDATFKADYEKAVSFRESLMAIDNGVTYEAVRDMLGKTNNYNYYFQEAAKVMALSDK